MKTMKIIMLLTVMLALAVCLFPGTKKPVAPPSATIPTVVTNAPVVPAESSIVKATPERKVDAGTHNAIAWLIPIFITFIGGLFKLSKDSWIVKTLILALAAIWDAYCNTDNKYAAQGLKLDQTTWTQRKVTTVNTLESNLPEKQKSLVMKIFGSLPAAVEYVAVTIGKGMALKDAIKGIKW